MTAASTAVRKHDEPGSIAWNGQISVEHVAGEIDLYRARCDGVS